MWDVCGPILAAFNGCARTNAPKVQRAIIETYPYIYNVTGKKKLKALKGQTYHASLPHMSVRHEHGTAWSGGESLLECKDFAEKQILTRMTTDKKLWSLQTVPKGDHNRYLFLEGPQVFGAWSVFISS